MTRYSREDALRILHLSSRELAVWERAGLFARQPDYGFAELSQMRLLRDLRHAPAAARSPSGSQGAPRRISASRIRASIEAMQRAAGVRSALSEAGVLRQGSRLAFRHGGALVDPLTQQLQFDFEVGCDPQTRVLGGARAETLRAAAVQEMFLRAVQMEEDPAKLATAIELYQRILEVRPTHAPALINLGTIFYNRREYHEAERLYRRASEADPDYALAFFDLGNVLDEMQRLPEAIASYERAVALVPGYADAHYNLALAYERQGQRRLALRHWLRYVRLDPAGPWNAHARGQARKILKSEKLAIVSRGGRLVQAG